MQSAISLFTECNQDSKSDIIVEGIDNRQQDIHEVSLIDIANNCISDIHPVFSSLKNY